MKREVVLSGTLYAQLRQHLFQNPNTEQLAFILAGVQVEKGRLRLLARELIPVQPADFQTQSAAYLSVKDEFTRQVLQRCREEELSLVEAHSHPFCQDYVTFSGVDTANEQKKFTYVADRLPNIYHATMVLGQENLDAHMWDRRTKAVLPIDQVRVIEVPIKLMQPTSRLSSSKGIWHHFWSSNTGGQPEERFARQVAAFGAEGQRLVGGCQVGIVGVGGIGSAVAEQLAHLGVVNLLLIDHDIVEEVNLNRMIGATANDAQRQRPKVQVVKRLVHRINPKAKVQALSCSIFERKALVELRKADVIVGCTDNHGTRLLLNRLAAQYLIPYIDIGTGIEVDEAGNIRAAGGQVRTVLPGEGFCLECIEGIDRQRAAQDLMPPAEYERERARGYIEGADIPAPAVIFLNQIMASIAVGEFWNLFTAFKPTQPLIFYDLLMSRITAVAAERQADCPCCGEGALLALGDLEPLPEWHAHTLPTSVPAAGCVGQ